MYKIQIRLRCCEKFSEVLPEMLEITECAVENVVTCSLLELFDTVDVDEVSVSFSPEESEHNDADHDHR